MKNVILLLSLIWGSFNLTNASGQSLSARLELEITSSKEFGKILSVRTVIQNNTSERYFLDNFLSSINIEKLDEEKSEFKDYFEYWFVNTTHDPNGKNMASLVGIVPSSRDTTFDKLCAKEIIKYNTSIKDSAALKIWTTYQVDRIKVLNPKATHDFQFYINSLPLGSYRLGFHYSNLKDSGGLAPVERFKNIRLPNTLINYTRWKGEIDSGYLYLTLK